MISTIGANASAKKVTVDRWVAEICESFGDWITTTGDIDQDLQGGIEDLGAGNTTAKPSRALALELLDEAVEASVALANEAKTAGTPKVDRGAELAKKYRATTVKLGDIYRDERAAFAKLKLGDDEVYLANATKAIDDTIAAFGRTDFPLDQLAKHPDVDAAMAMEPSCQALNSDFPTAPFAVGDCVDGPAESTATQTTLGDFVLGTCDGPHTAEVFSIFSIPAAEQEPFPGQEAIVSYSEPACVADFEEYVGLAYSASIFEIKHFTPIEATWELGDREVVCMLTAPGGAPLDESARGSAL